MCRTAWTTQVITYLGRSYSRWLQHQGINVLHKGCDCGSVGRAVAFITRGPQFNSSHGQILYWTFVCLQVYYQLYWKDENKLKEAGNCPLFKKPYFINEMFFELSLDQMSSFLNWLETLLIRCERFLWKLPICCSQVGFSSQKGKLLFCKSTLAQIKF